MRLAGASALALASAAASAQSAAPLPPAGAAAAVPEDQTPGGEIVVTARRVNETLSQVPASITAFSSDTIEKLDIRRAEDFVQLTPGVTIVTSTAEAGDTQINIRGINGARDAESSVALVVDGILKTNVADLNQSQGTLRQVEVLKGPQGALYGRNAAAGAIVVQTVKPTERLTGAVKASYGRKNTFNGDAYIAGPLTDSLGFVLSGSYRRTDGFYRNIYLDRKVVDDQRDWNVGGRLIYGEGTDTTLDLKGRYGELHGASINFNAAFHLPSFGTVNPAFDEDANDHRFRYYSNIRPTNDQRTTEFSAKFDHDFGRFGLTAWGLYSDIKNSLTADGTSADFARYIGASQPAGQRAVNACFASTAALTGFPVNQPGNIGQIPVPFLFAPTNGSTFGPYSPTTCDGTQYQIRNQRDVSGEVRLHSNGDGPLSWQIGAYYLHIRRTVGVSLGADTGSGITRELYNAPDSANPTSQLFADRFRTNVYAGFGSIDYRPDDRFDATVALRYDIEQRHVRNLVPLAIDPFTGGPINPGQAFGSIDAKSKTFRQLEPKISLRYGVAPHANIFANYGIGFKAGGFNNQGSAAIVSGNFDDGVTPGTINANVTISDQFRKEKSDAFEAGIKGRLMGINYNLAGYYTRVHDMQFFEFFVGSFGLLRVVSNIDRVDLKGAELNLDAKLIDGWTVFASGNYTDSEIKKNRTRPYTVGNRSPYTAKYTINLGSQIDEPLREHLDIVARADYRITGPTYFATVQDQTRPTLFSGLIPISALGGALPASFGDANFRNSRRDTFGVLNLRLGLEGSRWRATLFCDNVADKHYLNEVIPAIEFGGSFISPGARRLYGVELGYKF